MSEITVYCTGCGSQDLRYECKNCSDSTADLRAKLYIAVNALNNIKGLIDDNQTLEDAYELAHNALMQITESSK